MDNLIARLPVVQREDGSWGPEGTDIRWPTEYGPVGSAPLSCFAPVNLQAKLADAAQHPDVAKLWSAPQVRQTGGEADA